MAELEQELIKQEYMYFSEQGTLQTTGAFSEMMKSFFDKHGFNIIITEKMIRNYIMDLN